MAIVVRFVAMRYFAPPPGQRWRLARIMRFPSRVVLDWMPPGARANTWQVAARSVVAMREGTGTPDAREALAIGLLPQLHDATANVILSGEYKGGMFFVWQHEGDYAASDMTAVLRLHVDGERILGAACLARPPCSERDRHDLMFYVLNDFVSTEAEPVLDVPGAAPATMSDGDLRARLESLDAAMARKDHVEVARLLESLEGEAVASPLSDLALDMAAAEGWVASHAATTKNPAEASLAIDLLRKALDVVDGDAQRRARKRACGWLAESYTVRADAGDLERASRAFLDVVRFSDDDSPELGWIALRRGVVEAVLAGQGGIAAPAREAHLAEAMRMFEVGRQALEEIGDKRGQVEIAIAEADARHAAGGDVQLARAAERYGDAWRLMTVGGAMRELDRDRFETLGRHVWRQMETLDRNQFAARARSRDGWRAFGVFLRPLTATRALECPAPDGRGRVTLEMALSDALAPDMSLIYVGGTPHPGGADWTIATSDTSSWEVAVQSTLGADNVAIVVPGYTPGLQWELRYLTTQGILPRTWLIMIPASCDPEAAERWEGARTAASAFDLDLPAYDEQGAFIRFHDGRTISHRLPFTAIWEARALLDSMGDMLPS